MPVGKGSIERAVKAKKEPKKSVIPATSPEVMEMVTGKRLEKAVRVGDSMPDYLL